MDEALRAELAALVDKVRAAAIPDACKQTAAWCFGRLPALYDKLRKTHESRYADEIACLVQWVLKELARSKKPCPESLELAVHISECLHLLHEQFGLPRMNFKLPMKPPPRSRKAG